MSSVENERKEKKKKRQVFTGKHRTYFKARQVIFSSSINKKSLSLFGKAMKLFQSSETIYFSVFRTGSWGIFCLIISVTGYKYVSWSMWFQIMIYISFFSSIFSLALSPFSLRIWTVVLGFDQESDLGLFSFTHHKAGVWPPNICSGNSK